MKPLEFQVTAHVPLSARAICDGIIDMAKWPEFDGYFLLPGIVQAYFETKTPELVGSRIRVKSTDGSMHVEEIVEWDPDRRVVLKFQGFQPPLQRLATHFIETWEFQPAGDGTQVTRGMVMYPKNRLGRLMLGPISFMMKKAFEKQLRKFQFMHTS